MEVEEDIIKSPHDDRAYRYIKLPNQLKALLISDSTTEKASAALSVRIGGLSDPEELPGLAHFCEHMLFLGTEKYPSENAYTEFVSHNGGTFNACTSGEFTTYFFDVGCDHLRGALDRFAQFFICPLFNADAQGREVNAVESENEKNHQVDMWRFNQVCRETATPGHPYRKFITGNKMTLETRPREQGIDVREELLKFHSTHYSSNTMALVLLGKESLLELTDLVLELFSPIQNKNVTVPSFPTPPYGEEQLQVRLEYVPVKEVRRLQVEFPLPDLTEYYDCDPSSYVAHLIGHEGSGSLLSYLRGKGWCNFLEAGPSPGAKGFMFFVVSVDLTEEGEEHVDDAVMAVFQYLAMMKQEGNQEWIFQECANLDEIDFQFKDKQKPITYTFRLTSCLQEYPPREVLRDRMQRHYKPDLIEMVLEQLQPKYVRLGILSQKFKGTTDQVEPWYGSAYSARKIDPKLVELWASAEPIPELHLPKPNEFIPTDFTIVPRPAEGEEFPTLPMLIKDTPMTKVWFKQDDTFFVPKASLYFKLSSPEVYRSATSNVETAMFLNLMMDDLKEYAYDAEVAGIEYALNCDVYAIQVSVGGYNHKQATLLSKIMNRMTNFSVDQKRFDIFKEMLFRHLRNFRAEQPHSHAMYYSKVILDSFVWTRQQLAEALKDVTCEMLQQFVSKFFAKIHIEALLHGNLTKQRCLELVELVEEALKSGSCCAEPLDSPLELHRQIILPHDSPSTFSVTNEVHSSCCVEFYLQVGIENTESNVRLELLSQILKEPCYDTLRTKEQLGYIVASGLNACFGAQGLRVLVQSGKSPCFVDRRIEAFLSKVNEILSGLSEESFEAHKKALAVKRLEKPKKLKAESSKYWSEVLMSQYHFNRDEVEVKCLMDLTKADILKFYSEYIAPGAESRHKLAVHVIPDPQNRTQSDREADTGANDDPQEEVDFPMPEATKITDISDFKSQLPFYPTIKPYIATSL